MDWPFVDAYGTDAFEACDLLDVSFKPAVLRRLELVDGYPNHDSSRSSGAT